jgi:hypothetical protein
MLGCSRASTPICGTGHLMRGRKPIPTATKAMMGNPGERPLNKREPKPKGELYAAPEWMSDSQREGWAWAITGAP